ncbi:TerB N-terminal domain-containing protein [Limosilactobacillus caecicola]|uniref:TerB N-terminal domain-containing protein n=1 Tax=Limosilactobacillus caecicola TaxID=2941332 RepID=UPI00204087AB|nr:TerB N-terminal domain-containing protein [Limosilactobacillus caecicola]
MEIQELQDYVAHKYGLHFHTTTESERNLQELHSQGQRPFALLSVNGGELDVHCPDFAQIIRQMSQFMEPRLMNHPEWVGMKFHEVSTRDLENVLDYAFKATTNGSGNFVAQQLVYLPSDDIDSKYQAQSIPQKAAVMKRRRLPAPLQKMVESYDYTILPANEQVENFYHQGQMVADYEDDYDQIYEFQRYYPDYHAMNAHQLRTYFAWRTQLRHGDFTVSSTSYAYVYIYELLNNIGVQDPEEGYRKLLEFDQRYASNYGQRMQDYLHRWLQDYVLYYGLDREKANLIFADQLATDRDYHILRHPAEYAPSELIAVFLGRSPYLKKCRLYRQAPDEWAKLVANVWQRVTQNQPEAIQELMATRTTSTKYFFAGAVYYFHDHPKLTKYPIDSERQYVIQDRKYSAEIWYPLKDQTKRLNNFFHEVDRLARQQFHLGHPLKARDLDQSLLRAIDEGLQDYQKQRAVEKQPKVELNMNELAQIRTDASATRESLLTEEEKQTDEEIRPQAQPTPVSERSVPVRSENESSAYHDNDQPDLTADERYLVEALLKQQPYEDYLKAHHLMASILVDGINEKLFDYLGDTAIEFNADDRPVIVEDYEPDLRELFKED